MSFAPVCTLSDDDDGGPVPLAVSPTQSKRKKRLRLKRVVTTTADKCKKDILLKRLSTTCPCAQKTCPKQFLEKEKFAEYLQYMREWFGLAKVDQDQIATCRLPYNIFFLAVARVELSTCTILTLPFLISIRPSTASGFC